PLCGRQSLRRPTPQASRGCGGAAEGDHPCAARRAGSRLGRAHPGRRLRGRDPARAASRTLSHPDHAARYPTVAHPGRISFGGNLVMARGFHAVLKSLSDHEVELLFDDALWNGSKTLKNVRVELYERDRTLGTPRGRTVDDALGTVFVDLKQGPPNKHGSPTVEISAARFEPPGIKKVHSGAFDLVVGPEKFRVAVFMDPEEWKASMPPPWAYEKRNFIELGLDIS